MDLLYITEKGRIAEIALWRITTQLLQESGDTWGCSRGRENYTHTYILNLGVDIPRFGSSVEQLWSSHLTWKTCDRCFAWVWSSLVTNKSFMESNFLLWKLSRCIDLKFPMATLGGMIKSHNPARECQVGESSLCIYSGRTPRSPPTLFWSIDWKD